MNITLEKIDLLIDRANVTYAQAKEALESTDGDLVEALIYLEKNAKIKEPKKNFSKQMEEKTSSFGQDVRNFINDINKNSFKIQKSGKVYINLPLLIAALLIICSMPFSIILFAILLIAGYKINITKEDGSKVDINKKVQDAVDKFEKKE